MRKCWKRNNVLLICEFGRLVFVGGFLLVFLFVVGVFFLGGCIFFFFFFF